MSVLRRRPRARAQQGQINFGWMHRVRRLAARIRADEIDLIALAVDVNEGCEWAQGTGYMCCSEHPSRFDEHARAVSTDQRDGGVLLAQSDGLRDVAVMANDYGVRDRVGQTDASHCKKSNSGRSQR